MLAGSVTLRELLNSQASIFSSVKWGDGSSSLAGGEEPWAKAHGTLSTWDGQSRASSKEPCGILQSRHILPRHRNRTAAALNLAVTLFLLTENLDGWPGASPAGDLNLVLGVRVVPAAWRQHEAVGGHPGEGLEEAWVEPPACHGRRDSPMPRLLLGPSGHSSTVGSNAAALPLHTPACRFLVRGSVIQGPHLSDGFL